MGESNSNDNFVNLQISPDLIEAYITVSVPEEGLWPDAHYIINLLNSNGICSIVLNDEVARIINEKINFTPVCVARGEKMIPSWNGWIEYLYEKQEKEFDPDDMDAVDHKNRSRIKTVSKGDRIIRLHPAVPGKDGVSVTGEIITAGSAIDIKMPAGKDIIAADYLINCVSHADGSIIVTKKKGMIAGGTTVAFSRIEANTIGNSSGLKTIVSVGFSSELRQQLIMIDSEQTKNIHDLGHINEALKKISRISMIKKQLPATIANQAKDLMKMKELIEEQINKALEKQVTVLDTLSDIKNASIRVNGTMYPGAVINFPDIQKLIKDEVKKSILKIENGMLQINPVR